MPQFYPKLYFFLPFGRLATFVMCLFWLGGMEGCRQKAGNPTQTADSLTTSTQPEQQENWQPGNVWEQPEATFFMADTGKTVWLVFFDPQGNGRVPVELYRGLALKYGVNLLASNRSKNGNSLEYGEEIALQLIRQVLADAPGQPKSVYFSGFSGGAKVALSAGMVFPEIKGVVYSGAPFLADQISKPVLGFAGSDDMNYADLLAFDQAIPESIPHHLVEWKGEHAWPDPATFERAFQWIAGKEGLAGFDSKSWAGEAETVVKGRLPVTEKVNHLLFFDFAARESKTENGFATTLRRLQKTPEYQKQKAQQKQILAKELELKEMYNQAFIDKDIPWWKSEIAKLRNTTEQPQAMNHRLLGHFSLAAYSHAVNLLGINRLELAEKCLEIYRLADPENPEQAYLRAVLAGKREEPDQILLALDEAITLGFKDKARTMEQPEFQMVRNQPGFQPLVDRMKD